MNEWILISIFLIALITVIAIAIAFLIRKNKKQEPTKEPDYRAFFVMGISFLPMGIIFTAVVNPGFIGFIALGIIYIAIGLGNRDKWIQK